MQSAVLVLEKDLVKLENMERTSEGIQRDGTTSKPGCELCDFPRKLSLWQGEMSIAQG